MRNNRITDVDIDRLSDLESEIGYFEKSYIYKYRINNCVDTGLHLKTDTLRDIVKLVMQEFIKDVELIDEEG